MVSHSYSYGPDRSKTKPLEIQTKWKCFFKQNVIGKQGAIGKLNRGLGIQFIIQDVNALFLKIGTLTNTTGMHRDSRAVSICSD